jgi:putative ABC transport system permease protein
MGMLGNVFLSFYRVTTRHPLYAALDLLGLSFGVVVFVSLTLYIRFETGFERWLPHSDQIYLARIRYTLPGRPTGFTDYSPTALLDTLKEDYSDLTAARMWQEDADIRKGETSSASAKPWSTPISSRYSTCLWWQATRRRCRSRDGSC